MNKKIDYWRIGDSLTARRLNNNLDALTELLPGEQQPGGEVMQQPGGAARPAYYNEPERPWYEATAARLVGEEQAARDGLAAGLYALQPGGGTVAAPPGGAYAPETMLAGLSSIAAGGAVYAVMPVNHNGASAGSISYIYSQTAPAGQLPNYATNTGGTYYKRVQTLAANPYKSASATDPGFGLQLLNTPDLELPLLTACTVASGSSQTTGGQTYTQQSLYSGLAGNTQLIKGLRENGGVSLSADNEVVNVAAGIEFYAPGASVNNTDLKPNPQPCSVSWQQSGGEPLTLSLTPINAWQWRLAASGSIAGGGGSLSIAQYTTNIPEHGVDGWILTQYMPMVYTGGNDTLISYRQLMRVYNGVLQVSFQRAPLGGNWEVYFSS